MEPQGSIPNSQELSTCSYPEPDQAYSWKAEKDITNISEGLATSFFTVIMAQKVFKGSCKNPADCHQL
jgi:hypothetical protein